MYPRRSLIVLGLLAFLASLVAFVPARLVLVVLPVSPMLKIVDPAGSLWHGRARIATVHEQYAVSWDLQAWRLLLLGLGGNWQVSATDMSAQGHLILRPWALELRINQGELAGSRLARIFSGSGMTIDQPLRLQGVAISADWRGEAISAQGSCAWGPGSVQVANRPAPLAVPALRGQFAVVDGKLRLVVDGEPAPGQTLATADADFRADEIHLVILQRAAEMVGWLSKSQRPPGTPFIELRQPLH